MVRRFVFAAVTAVALALSSISASSPNGEHHFLYVAEPGIRNYVEYGGIGVIVYDMKLDSTFGPTAGFSVTVPLSMAESPSVGTISRALAP